MNIARYYRDGRKFKSFLALLAFVYCTVRAAGLEVEYAGVPVALVQPQLYTLRLAVFGHHEPRLGLTVESGGTMLLAREVAGSEKPPSAAQVDYRGWLRIGDASVGMGLNALALSANSSGYRLGRSDSADGPVVSRFDSPTGVVAFRYALANGSNISVDYQPELLSRLVTGERSNGAQIGLRVRSVGSPWLGDLNSRSLRMNLDSSSYVALRTSRRGITLKYQATF